MHIFFVFISDLETSTDFFVHKSVFMVVRNYVF